MTALILGAGHGQRLGGRPKAFLDYEHRTLLAHAISLVAAWADRIVVGVRRDDLSKAEDEIANLPERSRITCLVGGASRQETLKALLNCATTPYVLVHEVARPWAQPEDFTRLLQAVSEHPAVVLYTQLPARDSIALVEGGRISRILPHSSVIAMQTPHAYQRPALVHAYQMAEAEGWLEGSTAALVKKAGYELHLEEGSQRNVKITYPEDLDALKGAADLAAPPGGTSPDSQAALG